MAATMYIRRKADKIKATVYRVLAETFPCGATYEQAFYELSRLAQIEPEDVFVCLHVLCDDGQVKWQIDPQSNTLRWFATPNTDSIVVHDWDSGEIILKKLHQALRHWQCGVEHDAVPQLGERLGLPKKQTFAFLHALRRSGHARWDRNLRWTAA